MRLYEIIMTSNQGTKGIRTHKLGKIEKNQSTSGLEPQKFHMIMRPTPYQLRHRINCKDLGRL